MFLRGRYYFAPDGTPFVNGPTLLGSRVWHDNAVLDGTEPIGQFPPPLGESLTAKQRWDSGALPVALPDAVALGSLDCIAQGELLADGLPPDQQTGGFADGCFLPQLPPNPDFEFGFSVWQCQTQLFWADLLTQLAEGHADDVIQMCLGRFTGCTVSPFAGTLLYPAFAVVKHPSYCCLAMAGTDQLAQVLIQAIALVRGPQNYGTFSTGLLWYDFATFLLTQLGFFGLMDGRPILLAGHSYGGCTALVLAARLRQAFPKREIRYITFGAPKPGDGRLTDYVRQQFDGLSLVNDGDLVTALPPTGSVISAMSAFLPVRNYLPWTQWSYPPETTLMIGKRLEKNTYQRFDSITVAQYILNVFAFGRLLNVPAHAIQEYGSRIRQRCKAFIPTDLGEVLGMGFQLTDVAQVGEVYGMTFQLGDIPTPCCPSGTPASIPITIVSAGPPNDFLNGLTWTLTYNIGTGAWHGTGHSGPNSIVTILECTGVGGDWHLVLQTYALFNRHTPSACGTLTFTGLITVGFTSTPAVIVVNGTALPAVVQTIGVKRAAAVASLQSDAFAANVTAGNTLIVTIAVEDIAAGSSVPTGVNDTNGNSYTQDASSINGPDRCYVYRKSNALAGAANKITVTTTAASYITILGAVEVSNLNTSSPIDGPGSTNVGTGPTAANTGTFSTTHPTCLIIVAFANQDLAARGYADPAGFTLIANELSGGTFEDGASDYEIVSTPQASINPTWSSSAWGASRWAAIAIAYKGV